MQTKNSRLLAVPALSGLLAGVSLMAFAAASDLDHTPILMEVKTIEDLETELAEILTEAETIEATAAAENRSETDEELERIDQIVALKARLDRIIANKKALAPVAGAGRRTAPEPRQLGENRRGEGGDQGAGRRTVLPTARNNDGKWGFENFGVFAQTVKRAGGQAPQEAAVNRINNALTTFAQEGVGSDGGFLVPPEFRREVAIKVMGEESLLSRTDRITSSSNAIVIPTDETTPYGTSGVQAYWENEAGLKTQSKPVFGQNTLRLNKLIALVPVSDEMLEDAPQINSYLSRKVPDVFTAKINTAIISGSGVGQPLGFMASAGLITVAKHPSQPADSIWFQNIVQMYSRMRAASLPRAIWLINQSILPQLFMMSFDPQATAGKVPVYLPGGMAATAPFGTLLGRPILPIEGMAALGDLGDIAFVDLSQYLSVTKGGDIKTDVSMHLFFDYDITAFRFVFRLTGQPWWNSAVTPQASGAPTIGQFITLQART